MKRLIATLLVLASPILAFCDTRANYTAEVIAGLLGDLTPAEYTVSFIFAGIGLLLRWGWTTYKGITNQTNGTPTEFSLKYWTHHNAPYKILSVLLNFLAIFISLRFPKELMETINMQFMTNFTLYFYAFMVGIFLDYIVDKMRHKSEQIRTSQLA